MATRVMKVKRSLTDGGAQLETVKGGLGGSPKRKVESVQKSLSKQQLRLDFVLRRLAFHKAKTAAAETKVRALKARLRGRS